MNELLRKLILTEDEVLNLVKFKYENKEPFLLTYLNQHCFNIAWENIEFLRVLKNSFKVYIADYGFCQFYSLLFRKIQLFNATDLNEKIINLFKKYSESVILIGGGYNRELLNFKMTEKKLKIEKYFDGFSIDIKGIREYLVKINFPIIFIGMGVPKQEILAYELSKIKKESIIICVGNFFEFYFGTKKRAPKIIQKIGLEWLFRLITEPKRLWKRYIIGIPMFIYRVIKLRYSIK